VTDFWLSCGHHLLDRVDGGGLLLTDEFLKAYMARPELAPPAEACVVERTLHAALMADPRRSVSADEIAAIADQDARENWQIMIDFRDQPARSSDRRGRLCGAGAPRHRRDATACFTISSFTSSCAMRSTAATTLTSCGRANCSFARSVSLCMKAHCLRPTKSGLPVRRKRRSRRLRPCWGSNDRPRSMFSTTRTLVPIGGVADRFDMALDLTAGRRGTAALGEVIARWIGHVMSVAVEVEPVVEVRNAVLTWYVGLDAEATKIGDALWRGYELDEESFARVVALYRLRFADPSVVSDRVADDPAYLILAMTPEKVIRVKPQNLVSGLPIKRRETVLPTAQPDVWRS